MARPILQRLNWFESQLLIYPDLVGDMHRETNEEQTALIPLIRIYERNEMKHKYIKLTQRYVNNNRDTVKRDFYSIKKSVETVKCRMKTILLEWW